MRVVVVDAYPPDHDDAPLVGAAIEVLEANGNEVERLDLYELGFSAPMSAAERRAYHEAQPLVTAETRAGAAAVSRADGLLFCYPTTLFGVPPVLKSWLERVLVAGVSFVFDRKGRVRPGMTHVRRVGVVTTSPHGRMTTLRHVDLGRRMISRTVRMNCHKLCRRTFVRLPIGVGVSASRARLERRLGVWA